MFATEISYLFQRATASTLEFPLSRTHFQAFIFPLKVSGHDKLMKIS